MLDEVLRRDVSIPSTLAGLVADRKPTDLERRVARAREAGLDLVECECGQPATVESLVARRPGQGAVTRTVLRCLAGCDPVTREEPRIEPETPEEVTSVEILPLCACGCGRRVKAEGRKLAGRECRGRWTRVLAREQPAPARPEPDVVERAKLLVREVPAQARREFFQRVVDVVEAEEAIRGLLQAEEATS